MLSSGKASSAPAILCLEYSSAVVPRESVRRDVELSVIIKDCEDDSMLWYFILVSPEGHISPGNLDEIVSLVASRLLLNSSDNKS